MLILNMALNLHLYVIQNNCKCDSPNSPPINVFTPKQSTNSMLLVNFQPLKKHHNGLLCSLFLLVKFC
jgi:hypothetical protein